AQNRESAVAEIAPSGNQTDARIPDLPFTALTAQLPRRLDDMIRAPDVRFREQPAVSIQRQFAAQFDTAADDEVLDLAPFAEAERLDLQHHHVGEAVIDFEKIDILVINLSHREGLRRGERKADHE